jgi:putative methyltransferase (TIGR04325 family)
MILRRMVRALLPPIAMDAIRAIRTPNPPTPEWEYVADGWQHAQAHPEVRGWDVEEILDVYRRRWPSFLSDLKGTAPLASVHESDGSAVDFHAHNVMMTFAYAIGVASRHGTNLKMLDWGGGIGHYYAIARALYPDITVDYHCKDLPRMASLGRQLLPEQHFYDDESCFDQSYDFVMASTSFHYIEDWKPLLKRLAMSTKRYLYLAQVPVVNRSDAFVFIQRPYAYGYATEYLAWCHNRTILLQHAEEVGLRLVREFVYGYSPLIKGAPEQNEYRGFLFQPAT